MTGIVNTHFQTMTHRHLLWSVGLFRAFVLFSSLFFTANSFALNDGTWKYELYEDGVTVTGCVDPCPVELVLPEVIRGYSLIRIEEWAFNANLLISVTIPDSVTTIGLKAFDSNRLTSVTISNNVTSIGEGAFEDNQLTSVIIGINVTSIGESAFESNQLTSVIIPDSVNSIGSYAFRGNQLPGVIIPDSVTTIEESTFASNQLTSVTIPDSVTNIGDYAFASNQLSSVIIPDSVTIIGDFAFDDNQLISVNFGASVTSTGDYAFRGNQLTSLIIPDNITSIGDFAFDDNQLTSVIIPDSVTSMLSYAFAENQLTSLSLSNNLSTIPKYTFANNQLTSVLIPDSVTSILEGAFEGNQLNSVTFGRGITYLWGGAFNNNELSNERGVVNFLGDRPLFIQNDVFDSDSLNMFAITYCADTGGWPGNPINNITPRNDCNGEKFAIDYDGDGINDDVDTDDDNDGLPDSYEISIGSDPKLVDSDNDGLTDNIDNNPTEFDEAVPTLYSGQLIVLPDINDDDIKEVGILKVLNATGQVTLDILNGQDQSKLKTLDWVDNYVDTTLALHVIPDMNDNGIDEVGLFGVQDTLNNEGRPQMFVLDLETGNRVAAYNWVANWKNVRAIVLDDLNGDGIGEIGLQGRFKEDNRPQLVVKTDSTTVVLDTYTYPELLVAPQYFQHSDVNGDGFGEISTFGRLLTNNKIQVKIASGIDSNIIMQAYNFPDKWDDISWHRLDDSNGDGIDDWGLFGTLREDGRPQLINKDGASPVGALRIFAWPFEMQNAQFFRIPDMNNDGVDEVAAAGRRSNNDRYQFQVQDGTDRNVLLANHNLNLNLESVSYHVLPDLSGDEQAEIGFLGINPSGEYELVIQHGDAANGNYATYNLGYDWQSVPSIASLGDTDNDGSPDLLIYGQNASGEQLLMNQL